MWRHSLELERVAANPNRALQFRRCPACDMARNKLFEGELVVRGVPAQARAMVRKTVENVGLEAFRRDPMDRILTMTEENGVLRVTTSENQLVQKMARKLKGAFRIDYQPKFSKEESTLRVAMDFSILAQRGR